jgi:hypothetical protein
MRVSPLSVSLICGPAASVVRAWALPRNARSSIKRSPRNTSGPIKQKPPETRGDCYLGYSPEGDQSLPNGQAFAKTDTSILTDAYQIRSGISPGEKPIPTVAAYAVRL